MTEWFTEILASSGYLGIFALLVLARCVPPVPAETVIPLAGVAAAQGRFSLLLITLAGGLGSSVGELLWFMPSRLLGRERLQGFLRRHGHWLTLSPEEADRAGAWFERHGGLAVLLSQPIPMLRTLIAIPAGALGQSWLAFLAYTTLGSCIYTFVLAGAGYMVQSGWPNAARYLGYFTAAVIGTTLAVYVVRLARRLAERRARGPRGAPVRGDGGALAPAPAPVPPSPSWPAAARPGRRP